MKILAALLLLLGAALPAAPEARAQVARGVVKEGLTLDSRVLGKPVRYTVYLPADYDDSLRHYPAVYLLHGYTDDDTGWMQFGEAHLLADEAIATRAIPPMILVMPDADVSWYVDSFDGSVRYEEFFIREFIPFIESQYRIRPEKRYRGVAGLSMGGHGSLVYAFRHPEMFAAVAAFSAAVYTDPETIAFSDERWARTESVVYGPGLSGKARLTPHQQEYNVLRIVERSDPAALRGVRIYLDCGDDDFLYRGNSALHVLLREKAIPHEYRVRDGGHTWSYWRTGLLEGLRFIGTSFHQP